MAQAISSGPVAALSAVAGREVVYRGLEASYVFHRQVVTGHQLWPCSGSVAALSAIAGCEVVYRRLEASYMFHRQVVSITRLEVFVEYGKDLVV